jgi:hypothetical protein
MTSSVICLPLCVLCVLATEHGEAPKLGSTAPIARVGAMVTGKPHDGLRFRNELPIPAERFSDFCDREKGLPTCE